MLIDTILRWQGEFKLPLSSVPSQRDREVDRPWATTSCQPTRVGFLVQTRLPALIIDRGRQVPEGQLDVKQQEE